MSVEVVSILVESDQVPIANLQGLFARVIYVWVQQQPAPSEMPVVLNAHGQIPHPHVLSALIGETVQQ